MGGRPRHQKPELEAVLRTAERQGWTVTKGNYFKMKCPCASKHMKTVHLSPSSSNCVKNLLGQLNRATCWRGE